MFVAAYAMTQPACKICIFSPGRRQSEMMLELIKDFVFKHDSLRSPHSRPLLTSQLGHRFPNGKNRVKKLNKENL